MGVARAVPRALPLGPAEALLGGEADAGALALRHASDEVLASGDALT